MRLFHSENGRVITNALLYHLIMDTNSLYTVGSGQHPVRLDERASADVAVLEEWELAVLKGHLPGPLPRGRLLAVYNPVKAVRELYIERYVDNDRTIAMIKRVVSQGSNDSSDENDFWWCISVLKFFLNDREREIPEILSTIPCNEFCKV